MTFKNSTRSNKEKYSKASCYERTDGALMQQQLVKSAERSPSTDVIKRTVDIAVVSLISKSASCSDFDDIATVHAAFNKVAKDTGVDMSIDAKLLVKYALLRKIDIEQLRTREVLLALSELLSYETACTISSLESATAEVPGLDGTSFLAGGGFDSSALQLEEVMGQLLSRVTKKVQNFLASLLLQTERKLDDMLKVNSDSSEESSLPSEAAFSSPKPSATTSKEGSRAVKLKAGHASRGSGKSRANRKRQRRVADLQREKGKLSKKISKLRQSVEFYGGSIGESNTFTPAQVPMHADVYQKLKERAAAVLSSLPSDVEHFGLRLVCRAISDTVVTATSFGPHAVQSQQGIHQKHLCSVEENWLSVPLDIQAQSANIKATLEADIRELVRNSFRDLQQARADKIAAAKHHAEHLLTPIVSAEGEPPELAELACDSHIIVYNNLLVIDSLQKSYEHLCKSESLFLSRLANSSPSTAAHDLVKDFVSEPSELEVARLISALQLVNESRATYDQHMLHLSSLSAAHKGFDLMFYVNREKAEADRVRYRRYKALESWHLLQSLEARKLAVEEDLQNLLSLDLDEQVPLETHVDNTSSSASEVPSGHEGGLPTLQAPHTVQIRLVGFKRDHTCSRKLHEKLSSLEELIEDKESISDGYYFTYLGRRVSFTQTFSEIGVTPQNLEVLIKVCLTGLKGGMDKAEEKAEEKTQMTSPDPQHLAAQQNISHVDDDHEPETSLMENLDTVEDIFSRLDDHAEHLHAIDQNMAAMGEAVHAVDDQISDIATNVKTLTTNVSIISENLTQLQQMMGTLTISSTNSEDDRKAVHATLNSLSKRIITLETSNIKSSLPSQTPTATSIPSKPSPTEVRRQSIIQAQDPSIATTAKARLSLKFFKARNSTTASFLPETNLTPTPTLPTVSIRANSLKQAAKAWFDTLSSTDRWRIRQNILDSKSSATTQVDVSTGTLPRYYIDAVIADMEYSEDAGEDWDGRLKYFAVDSGYMDQDITTKPMSTTTSSSTGGSGGVVVIQRQTDTIPDVLKLHPNVDSLACKGSTLYHVINFKQNYTKWLSNPGNTPDTVRLVYAVPKKVLQSILVAHCNHDLMSAGGYTSNSVALIPNDVFIQVMFRMLRPSSVSEFLEVLSDAARFPAYPKGLDKTDITTANFNVMIELAYIYCDKVITTYDVLCSEIKDINTLPSMYAVDEQFRGLKGLFVNNFRPAYYIMNLLSSLSQEQKDILKSDITFQQYVTLVKELLVEQYEKWKLVNREIGSMLQPRRQPDTGELAVTPYYHNNHSKTQDKGAHQQKLNHLVTTEDSSTEDDAYLDQEYERPVNQLDEDTEEDDLRAFQQPQATKPPTVGKQFDPRAIDKNGSSTNSKSLYTPKAVTTYSSYSKPKIGTLAKQPSDPSSLVCFSLLQNGVCTKTNCAYNHSKKTAEAALARYGDNLKKFFEGKATQPKLSHMNEQQQPTDEELLAELAAMASQQGLDAESMGMMIESFSVIKGQQAPMASSKNFSAVHMDGEVVVTGIEGGEVRVPVSNILLDTGATHGNYIASAILRKWEHDGIVLLTESVNANVRLGDNKTLVAIKSRVHVPVEIKDMHTGIVYSATVLCSVIECGTDVPIIIGLPAIGRYFTSLVCSALEQYAITANSEREYLSKLEALELNVPWSVGPPLMAMEELETPDTGLYEELTYLTVPRDEASAKHAMLVQQNISPEWKEHETGARIIELLNSAEGLQTFLPEKWEGFKNVQAIGANDNDEFTIQFRDTLPDSMPCQPRSIAERLKGAAIPELYRLVSYLLTHSDSAIASPTVVAPKATDPFVRIAGDYRGINMHVYINQEYIPRVQFEIMKCKGFSIFLDFDLTNSFHQIKLDFLSSCRLSLSTLIGLLRPLFMPEGVSCGSMMLQKIVRWIFREIEDYSIILFDNILILAHDFEDAYAKCEKFLAICRRHNVILKMAKTFLGHRQVSFFGYTVKENTVSLASERKDAIMSIALPRNLKEAQSFLGASIFFKTFVRNFSEHAAHIAAMTSSKFSWDQSTWTVDYKAKFEDFKKALCDASVVHYPDYNLPWIIQTDGSNLAVGGVLFQIRDGEYEPLAFVSHKLSETASRWDIHKIECFAIFHTVFKLSYLLLGKQFIVETDHANLLFMEKSEFAIVIRWRCFLQQFAFFLRHIPGKLNVMADYMSRMFHMLEEEGHGEEVYTEILQHLSVITSAVDTTPTITVHFEGPVNITLESRPTTKWGFLFDAFLRKLIVHYDIPLYGFTFSRSGTPINPSNTLEDTSTVSGDIVTVVAIEADIPSLNSMVHNGISTAFARCLRALQDINWNTREDSTPGTNATTQVMTAASLDRVDDIILSPEQCITWMLGLIAQQVNSDEQEFIIDISTYRNWVASSGTSCSRKLQAMIRAVSILSEVCELPFLSISDLVDLNREMNRFSLSYAHIQRYLQDTYINWHEYNHYAKLPCHSTSSVLVSSQEEAVVRNANFDHTPFGVCRKLLVVDVHSTQFPAVSFDTELLVPPRNFCSDIYQDFVHAFAKRQISSSASTRTIGVPWLSATQKNLAYVIVRYTGYYNDSTMETVPSGFVIFRTDTTTTKSDYIQRWAVRLVKQHLFLPSIQHIRVLINGLPTSMHTKYVCQGFYARAPVFDIFVTVRKQQAPAQDHEILSPTSRLPVFTHPVVQRLDGYFAPLLYLQPPLLASDTIGDLRRLYQYHLFAVHFHQVTLPTIIYVNGEGGYRRERCRYYVSNDEPLAKFSDTSKCIEDFRWSGHPAFHVEMDTKVPDQLRGINSEDEETLYTQLLYSFEERLDPVTGNTGYFIKGTDTLVNMQYWMDNMESRMKGTQGPPAERKAERKAMILKAKKSRSSNTSKLFKMEHTSLSNKPIPKRHRTSLSTNLESWISSLDYYQEPRLVTHYDIYYDDMARVLSIHNMYLYKRDETFRLRYADIGHTGIFEETCTSYEIQELDKIVATIISRCELEVERIPPVSDNPSLENWLKELYISPFASIKTNTVIKFHQVATTEGTTRFISEVSTATLRLLNACDYGYSRKSNESMISPYKDHKSATFSIDTSTLPWPHDQVLASLVTSLDIPNLPHPGDITELIFRFDSRHYSKLVAESHVSQRLYLSIPETPFLDMGLEVAAPMTDVRDQQYIEVECKFRATPSIVEQLNKTHPTEPIRFMDTYYDTDDHRYSCQDFWLRKRDDKFQLKHPSPSGHQGGVSSYTETEDPRQILMLLGLTPSTSQQHSRDAHYGLDTSNIISHGRRQKTTSSAESLDTTLSLYGITPFAHIITTRSSHKSVKISSSRKPSLHHVLQVDIDSAKLVCKQKSSTYKIAEVELIKAARGSTPVEAITDFINSYKLDPTVLTESLNGKLIECLRLHSNDHYNQLVASGIVKVNSTPSQLTYPSPTKCATDVPTADDNSHPDNKEPPENFSPNEEGNGDIEIAVQGDPLEVDFDPHQYVEDSKAARANRKDAPVTDLELEAEPPLPDATEFDNEEDEEHPDFFKYCQEANQLTLQHMKKVHTGNKRTFHHGASKMYMRCKELFPNNIIPYAFFQEFVNNCGHCQKIRARFAMHFNRLVKTIKDPTHRRSAIGIDVLHIGHADYRGNTLLIVIVQFFSRHVYAYPTNTYAASTIVEALMTYYSLFGLFDIMSSDPGSDLLASVVKLFNDNVNVEHKISMVDEHGSTGVENQGCKRILEHLKCLVMHNDTVNRWSSPAVLGYALMIINNTMSSETGYKPFEAIFGEPDRAWLRTILPPFQDPLGTNQYLQELWSTQRLITKRSVEYQKSLHDKRVSSTPWESQKRYAKGDHVLKFREEVLKVNKLLRFKYLGPYKVTKHEIGSNFVYCYHMSSNKEYVFPVDKIIPFFCTSEDEARKVAQLDDQSYVLMDVAFYKGNPSARTTLQFKIRFEDDEEGSYTWYPFSQDLVSTQKVREYCETKKELSLLLMPQTEEKAFLSSLKKQKVTSVKPGDKVYLDLRSWSYRSDWFSNLELPYSDEKTYLIEAVYLNKYTHNHRRIDLKIPIFEQMGKSKISLLSVDEAFIYQFGSNTDFDPETSILVDLDLIRRYPSLKDPINQSEDI